jgi:hypothetical protein
LTEWDIIIEKSYELFRWALSHCGRFPINESIQKKVRILSEIFGIDSEDILHDLFTQYLEKEDYKRFDPQRGKLSTYINVYTNRWLYHEIRRYERINNKFKIEKLPDDYEDALDQENRVDHSLWFYEKIGRQENLMETITPEDYYDAKELWELIVKNVGINDSLVLIGVKDIKLEAERLGLDYYTYCQRLNRKKRILKERLQKYGYWIKELK